MKTFFTILVFNLFVSSIAFANLHYPYTIQGTLVKIEGNNVHLEQEGRIVVIPKKFIKDPLVPKAMMYVKINNKKEYSQVKTLKN